MSTVITQRWDAITPAQYDQILELVRWDRDVPAGMTFHVASFEQNVLCMTDIWDSAGQFTTFAQTRIAPAISELGRTGFPEMSVSEVHDIYRSASNEIGG
jgi:hypothetical protein